MQTPDTPQLSPIEKAIEIIKDIADNYVDEKMSDQDKAIASALYKAVDEIRTNVKPYERQYLRDGAEKTWDACDRFIEERQEYRYGRNGGYKNPSQTEYLNQNHPL